ncbi:hypothetical protein BDW22DRAFT_1433139 [Trametopsis cervina]|nr:hypothetical protein BDW22DRAFT_1433139 [Trametopsis cervina]
MSGVRSEAHVAEPQFSADGDMDDTRSELSYVDISELTRLTMDVEAVHGIADDRPDMDVESEDPMSLVVDPVDASAHSAQATVEAVPISSGLEAGGADSNLEGPAPGVPEGSSVVQRAREIAAEFGANLAVIAQAALTEDWALLEGITPHSSEEVATEAIVPPGNTERKMGSKRVSQPRKARVASRRAQPPNASTNASPVRKPLRSKDGAMVRRSGRAAKPRQAGTWDYDDAVLRQAKASRK